MLPFIKKKDPAGEHSTAIDIKELKKNPSEDIKTATSQPKALSVVIKPDFSVIVKNKYLIATIGSAVFCLAGFGFWIYVQFFLSP